MNEIATQKWISWTIDHPDLPATEETKKFFDLCRDGGRQFQADLASSLLAAARRKFRAGRWNASEVVDELFRLGQVSETAQYLAACLERETDSGSFTTEEANRRELTLLRELEHSLTSPDSFLACHVAKTALAVGNSSLAIAELRQALALHPPITSWLKCQTLTEKLLKEAPSGEFRRSCRLAVLGSCTTTFLAHILKSAALARGIRLEVYEAPYGNYNQEILDPNSKLYQFKPEALLLLLESHDLAADPLLDHDDAENYVHRIQNLWNVFRRHTNATIIQTGLEIPSSPAWGALEYTLHTGRVRQIEFINRALSENLPDGVSFIHPAMLTQLVDGPWSSPRDWYVAKQYPAPSALPVLADAVSAHLAASLGLAKKVLVLDLDNTCWGGVVGEDLTSGIKIGSSSGQGESFSALQQYAKDLQTKGILLAVCSKNNEADAIDPFLNHPDMILHRDDFVAFRANWNDKVSNLRSIAEELSLGLDSFVFIDDNPVERALVRRNLPDVTVLEFDNHHWKIVPALQRAMYFDSCSYTHEDQHRHESYLLRAHTMHQAANVDNIEDFLLSLKMTAQVQPVDQGNLTRVTQLINKSNQFNLTTRRYTQEEIAAMARSDSWWLRAFRLTDCYQDHGLVGLLFAEKGHEQWRIDSFVMSCRVIGRRLEDFMLKSLVEDARQSGAKTLLGQYIPTPKNDLVREFLPQHGFQPVPDSPERWTIHLSECLLNNIEVFAPHF
ncbi:MAG: HAD-IIIC family phosphatase [Planctomycetia bacterium]|nr:HAD-IIIC family phosphatase [Planctomycetia bacterium]